MRFHTQALTPLGIRIVVGLGAIIVTAGSVLVFMIPQPGATKPKSVKPSVSQTQPMVTPTPTQKPDPVVPHQILPPKVTHTSAAPSKPKAAPRPSPSHSAVHVQPSRSSTPSPRPVTSSPTPTPTPVKTTPPPPSPTPTPTVSKPPTSSPPPPPTTSVRWYTDPAAVAAAQRMDQANVVGDPVCSLASQGQPNPSLIPQDVKAVGTGRSGEYWCLIFKR